MKNTTLIKIILSLVFVFSSEAAFTIAGSAFEREMDQKLREIDQISKLNARQDIVRDTFVYYHPPHSPSKERVRKVSKALKSFGEYPAKYTGELIPYLLDSIEYGLPSSSSAKRAIFEAGLESLFKVLSREEAFKPYFERLLNKLSYDFSMRETELPYDFHVMRLKMIIEQILSRHEVWEYENFSKWIERAIKTPNHEVFQSLKEHLFFNNKFQKHKKFLESVGLLMEHKPYFIQSQEKWQYIFSRRAVWRHLEFPKLIKMFLDEANRGRGALAYYYYRFIEELFRSQASLQNHPFFKQFFNKKTIREEGYYRTLKRAIVSGEYDRAYTAYINEMNSEIKMQKVMRLLKRSGKEETKPNACRKLFSI